MFPKLIPLLLAVIILAGCTAKEKPITLSEAEKNLIAFCQKEGDLTIFTRTVQKTLWIYIPLHEPLFTVKPTKDNDQEKRKTPLGLLYLGGEFDEHKKFSLNYDIVPDIIPPDPVTYGSAYNELYTKKRQLLYQGFQETLFNIPPEGTPDFIVIIVADVKTGVGTRSTMYLNDIKQYMSEALPGDEYYLREWNEVFGDEKLIGDAAGKNIHYSNIEWPDFLLEQIKTRIRFKFTQSDFPPESEAEKTIATIAANTLRFYPFTDHNGIYLYNIRAKRDVFFSKEELKIFEEKSRWEGKGKLTTIRFDASQLQPIVEESTR